MKKVKSNVNDARLKARRTSLMRKDKEGLVNIILRKDDVERKNNEKIQKLNQLLNEADELNEEKAKKLSDIIGTNDYLIKTNDYLDESLTESRNEVIDLTQTQHYLESEVERLKDVCNFRRKVIIYLAATCVILITTLVVF